MVQYIITPWRTPADLLLVRQQLYNNQGQSSTQNGVRDDADRERERRKAVAQVSVWMQRGNCPHLVEASAILTSAILNDVPGNSTYCVRAAYSAAFCRFVTGLLDSHQTSHKKLSMYSIARTLSLPATYVELRHQATHEELPSLAKLRSASVKALRWIWEFYWVKLSEVDVGGEREGNGDECKEFVRRYLQEADDEGMHMDVEVEASSRGWDRARLMAAITGIQNEVANPDARLLLLRRASRLQQQFLDSETGLHSAPPPPPPIPVVKSLQDLKREMEEMEMEMEIDPNNEGTDDGSRETDTNTVTIGADYLRLSGKGWAAWEGAWVPKPIGVV
ncbi:Pre-rRNA-processing protein [Lachnellula hyalina]|uniref:Pre-rRNA-processing protein n=1 Tax=Lachnellula hyalina TaxID=1316788 RepID=A0A8H8U0L8_9HELO|nr:Pre-rRNA-processing protein [Lachnellula hyalina]TVY29455.1 Pre-rRNA-processing protein [Lachnellula hyalina]